jgi:hypothetical protein
LISNAQDTSPLSWDRFFSELARWYGAPGVALPEEDESKYQKVVGKAGKETPLGRGPPMNHKVSFSYIAWAKESENQQAWKDIMANSKGQVTSNPFEDPQENFQMADAILLKIAQLNMNKARRMGWTGYVDTIESIFEMFQENARLGLVPGMVVDQPNPMV